MEEQLYRISRTRIVVLAAALLLLALMALPSRADPGVVEFIVGVVVLVVCWVFWATGLEYRLTPDSIGRKSRFGMRSLRWEELRELRQRGEKRSYYLIPLGTYVTLWLRDSLGQKLTISGGGNVFGYLIACPTGVKQLQDEVLSLSLTPLLRHLESHFDAGEELQLGPLSLSRASGLRFKRLGTKWQIPLDELASFGVHEGTVYFYRHGAAKSQSGVAVAAVPNCFALLALLESLGVQAVEMQAGFLRPRATE